MQKTTPSGQVQVHQVKDGIVMYYDLFGSVDHTMNGIEIHAGHSCDRHRYVLENFVLPGMTEDPWTNSTYSANHVGNARGSTKLIPGFTLKDIADKTVVVDLPFGVRGGCGIFEFNEVVEKEPKEGMPSGQKATIWIIILFCLCILIGGMKYYYDTKDSQNHDYVAMDSNVASQPLVQL